MAASAEAAQNGISTTQEQGKATAEASKTIIFSDKTAVSAVVKKDDCEMTLSQTTLNQIRLKHHQIALLNTIFSNSTTQSKIYYKDIFELIEALGWKYEFFYGSNRIPSRSQFKLSYLNPKKVEYKIATPGRTGNDKDILLPYTIQQFRKIFSEAGLSTLIPKVQTSEDLVVSELDATTSADLVVTVAASATAAKK